MAYKTKAPTSTFVLLPTRAGSKLTVCGQVRIATAFRMSPVDSRQGVACSTAIVATETRVHVIAIRVDLDGLWEDNVFCNEVGG